jgi:hypothetical protein
MNIIEESEVDCFTLIDSILPILMVLSFIFGFTVLKILKQNFSQSQSVNDKLSKKHLKAQKNFNNENKNEL